MTGRLDGKRLAVLACDGVDRRELTGPREALEAEGAHVELIAPMYGEIHTVEHLEKTGTVAVDRALVDADPGRYDALVLPGGRVECRSKHGVRGHTPMRQRAHAPPTPSARPHQRPSTR
jgi:protease I